MLKAMASGELEDWPQRVRCFLVDQELSLNLEANPIEEVLAADTASLALQEEAAMLEEETPREPRTTFPHYPTMHSRP